MSAHTPETDLPARRTDTVLSFTALGLFALAVVVFFVIIIGSVTGMDFKTPLGATLSTVCYVAPIVAFILVMIVVFSNFRRKARANKAR